MTDPDLSVYLPVLPCKSADTHQVLESKLLASINIINHRTGYKSRASYRIIKVYVGRRCMKKGKPE